MKARSPHTPLRRPQNGTQAPAPGRDRRSQAPGLSRRYPVLGPPSSPLRGTGLKTETMNH
jgi:hypothetical protein